MEMAYTFSVNGETMQQLLDVAQQTARERAGNDALSFTIDSIEAIDSFTNVGLGATVTVTYAYEI